MPELTSRTDNEDALAAALLLVFGIWAGKVVASGGVFRVTQFQNDVREAIRDELESAYIEAALAMALVLAANVDFERISELARRWASSYSDALAKAIANQTSSQIQKAIAKVNRMTFDGLPGEIEEAFSAEIATTFGATRASGIAITEVTRAVSIAERDSRQRHGQETQEVAVPVWFTERDGKVCITCSPLDGKPEEFWVDKFPIGPPAHPNCRCWLEYEIGVRTA